MQIVIKLTKTIRVIKRILITFVFFMSFVSLGVIIGTLVYGYTWFNQNIINDLPEVTAISSTKLDQTTKFYDANDSLIYKTYGNQNRSVVPLEEIPADLLDAVISVEDKNFYSHIGISPRGMVRAAVNNLFYKDTLYQGGSTLTQQLVKNLFLTPERTYKRKLKEIVIALNLERVMSKDELLELYLNTVSFGSTAYGVEEASQMYFRKSVRDLNLAECIALAALPAAPTKFSPYTDIEIAKERQGTVLAAMLYEGKITPKEASEALKTPVKIYVPYTSIEHPHYVNYTQEYIVNKYGEDFVKSGGLEVYTTIDPSMQFFVEGVISEGVGKLLGYNVSNGAGIVSRNETGEILAMVGSIDYYSSDIDGYVNVTTAHRQPGSSIKPFNYALFLESGNTLNTTLNDSPITYNVGPSQTYSPKNYDNRFRGKMGVRRALANSINVASVKALEKTGVDKFINFIQLLGITTWTEDYYGLSLALGAGEVKMTELVPAYSVFPNGGFLTPLNPIRYILLSNGDVLEYNSCLYSESDFKDRKILTKSEPCRKRVLSPETSFLINSVLTDNNARREVFGTNSPLAIKGTGAKTGTTNEYKDSWTLGYNQEYTVGVWVGNNDNSQMSTKVSGVFGAGPIWNSLMSFLTTSETEIKIEDYKPESVVQVAVCPGSNSLPCEACFGVKEYFASGTEPKQACNNEWFPKWVEEHQEEEEEDD